MRIKTSLKNLSLVLSITLLGCLLPAKAANAASLSYAIKPSTLTNKVLTREETSQIESEIDVLDKCVDTSIIKKVNVTTSGNEYILGYNNIDEKVIIKNSNNESVTIIASDGKKSNVISYTKDGSLIIDGHKIEVSQVNQMDTNIAVTPAGTVWKSVKSFSPYGGLTSSDYSNYLNSGQQNLLLNQAIGVLTYTAFTTALGFINIYSAVMVGLAGVAIAIKDVIQAINTNTLVLGCKWTTWTAGSSDYEYSERFYANTSCTGSYYYKLSYEHFTVY
ncbi:MAG: hypothetical protein ACI8WT_004132 [Clostridium sp.]|jgi:hypothetical protein